MPLAIDLSHKIALITGGSGDLGRVITRTLADAGATVAIHFHRNAEKAHELCGAVQAGGGRAFAVQADVTDADSVQAMREAVVAAVGAPDIIVNTAVIQYQWEHVLSQPIEDFESQFRSCVLHNVIMAQTFVPAMIERGWGRVIALNTECSFACKPLQSAYVSGKRGMDGMLRVLAREVGPHGITVNQVAPGWIITDRDRARGMERQPDYEMEVPLRRRGEEKDIAHAIAFLASDLAGFITGAVLPVCGGHEIPTI